MASLLRKLATRAPWMVHPPWVPEGDAPAPPIADFLPPDERGKVSVWEVEENETNLERLVAAIAATRDFVQKVDFVLLGDEAAAGAGVGLEPTPGDSPDLEATGLWHRDLVNVSAQRAAHLVCAVFNESEPQRVTEKEVKELLRKAVDRGWLEMDRLRPKVKEKLKSTVRPRGLGSHDYD